MANQRLEEIVKIRTAEISSQIEKTKQAYSNIKLLSEIGQEITASLSVEGVNDIVYREIKKLMPVDSFGIGVYNRDLEQIEFPAFVENGKRLPFFVDELGDDDSLSDYCIKHKAEIFIKEADKEARKFISKEVKDARNKIANKAQSLIFLPLIVKNKIVGNMTVQSIQVGMYNEQHLDILRNIAAYVAVAIDNAETYQKIENEKLKVEQEQEKSEKLLLNILPKETAKELKETGKATPKRYENVSVLFTDFKGFTESAEKMSPEEVVEKLDHCFKNFDRIMNKHGLEKIKTIGDAYMAACGVPVPASDGILKCIEAASEILRFMRVWEREHKKLNQKAWSIRIGIHTGPVVAGVVGEDKFAYDIWGDTVNMAARMESNGETGKINISEEAYLSFTYLMKKHDINLNKRVAFEYRGEMHAKGKGMQRMYFVEMAV
jgi:class 3 adenylate cyclase